MDTLGPTRRYARAYPGDARRPTPAMREGPPRRYARAYPGDARGPTPEATTYAADSLTGSVFSWLTNADSTYSGVPASSISG